MEQHFIARNFNKQLRFSSTWQFDLINQGISYLSACDSRTASPDFGLILQNACFIIHCSFIIVRGSGFISRNRDLIIFAGTKQKHRLRCVHFRNDCSNVLSFTNISSFSIASKAATINPIFVGLSSRSFTIVNGIPSLLAIVMYFEREE